MLIIPAIDIYQGQCVRLRQGNFDQSTTYAKNPLDLALHYANLGAKKIHIVDLMGAKTGEIGELGLIKAIAQTPQLNVQVGGGIRSLSAASQALSAGASTLVIGSIAVSNPSLALDLIKTVGAQKIVLAIDVHLDSNGLPTAATHGWQSPTEVSAWDLIEQYQARGIEKILCTDIACDGMMQGPNFSLYEDALKRFPTLAWQASGGVRGIQDIRALAQLGMSAVILGRLLYEGDFNLATCLREFALC